MFQKVAISGCMGAIIRNVALNADMLAFLAADARLYKPETVVFLPNQRACSRLKALLIEQRPAAFVPQLMPLGQLDEVWLMQLAMQDHAPDAIESLLAIPQAINDSEAIMHLTQVMVKEQWLQGDWQMEQCWAAASAIWQVFETLESDAKPVQSIEALGLVNVSKHWRDRVLVLRRAAGWWHAFSQQHGLVRTTQRRNMLAQWLADYWQRSMPTSLIVIAGSTGSQASTLALMQSVMGLPQGEVWLQGMDTDWVQSDAPLAQSHPQMLFRRLLSKLPPYTSIENLGEQSDVAQALLNGFRSLCPAAMPNGIERVCADDEQQEAELTALLAKQALQQQGASVAIVLHQPKQLRRVQAALEVQGLSADSAMAQQAACLAFVRLLECLMLALQQQSSAPIWLALLKQLGWHELAQSFERARLRVRAPSSTHSMLSQLVQWAPPAHLERIGALHDALQSLMVAPHQTRAASEWLEQIITAMQRLGVVALSENELRICGDLRKAMRALREPLAFREMAALCRALLARMNVVLKGSDTARIKIYSPIEARLMQADCWILCGLNEQSWPAPQQSHPWLHPFLAQQLGLPNAALSVALAAHDFASLSASAANVFWLRSARADGVDQMPSRWLERFEMCENAKQNPYALWLKASHNAHGFAARSDDASPPAAYAPLDARPKQMTISTLTQLLKNPYGFYAKTILKLVRLEALNRQPDASYRGDIIHNLMEQLTHKLNAGAPLSRETYLAELEALLRHESEPIVLYQWAPRLRALADLIIEIEQQRRAMNPQILPEQDYEMILEGVQIKGRADRVEILGDSAAVIDYKSGHYPSDSELESGYEPQLALLAAMQPAPHCHELAYWPLSGVNGKMSIAPYKKDVSALITFYLDGISTLLQYYQREDARFLAVADSRPNTRRYNDYALLARQEIWSSS